MARMAEGRQVEELARTMFDGHLVEHINGLDAAISESQDVLCNPCRGDTFFRTVVTSSRLVAEVDIIHCRAGGRLDIQEVKSATTIKDENLHDIAFQRYVAEQAGLDIGECALITINSSYIRLGSMDVSGLFKITDVSGEVEDLMPSTAENITEALRIIDLPSPPDSPASSHCDGCPLADTPDGCFSHILAEPCNVFSLYRISSKRAWGWYGDGILRNTDIPTDYPLSEKQRIQVEAERTGLPYIDKGAVSSFYNQMEYPLFFLDFETIAPAIPLLQRSSPYQQIPFQYSLHVQTAPDQDPKDISHHSWIWDGNGDPRVELLHRLAGLLGTAGSIIVYNAQFERMILRQAVIVSPEHTDWLTGILGRFVDLLEPFRSFHYYSPAQHGSASIKSVLPALTGRGYENMDISNGTMASTEYMRVMFTVAGKKDRDLVMGQLREYCGLDTMGMVEIVGRLRGMREK
jgi:hypothetical protein